MALNVTIIAIASSIVGGLILFAGTTLYTDYIRQPNIEINLNPPTIGNDSSGVAHLIINNIGMLSAEDLRITLNSINALLTKPGVFSNSTLINSITDQEPWVISTTKLVPGGSISVYVNLDVPEPTKKTILNVFTAYSDRSSSATFSLQRDDLLTPTKKAHSADPFIQLLLIGVALSGTVGILIYYFASKRYFGTQSDRIRKKICEDANFVEKILTDKTQLDKASNDDTTLSTKLYSIDLWNGASMLKKYRLIGDKKYGTIDEFFQKIMIRDNLLKDGSFLPLADDKKCSINNEIRKLAKKVFESMSFEQPEMLRQLLIKHKIMTVDKEGKERDIKFTVKDIDLTSDKKPEIIINSDSNETKKIIRIPIKEVAYIDYRHIYVQEEKFIEYNRIPNL